VTGNANKLKEVKYILSQGRNPIEIDNQAIESALHQYKFSGCSGAQHIVFIVPEIQGTTVEVARDKCMRAAEAVSDQKLDLSVLSLMANS
jgi:inosine triphosphate pyrophosphatase